MKWFLAVSDLGPSFPLYADMIRVAVHTAQLETSVEPYLLYDGEENGLTGWLRARGVTVVPCRTYLYGQLTSLAQRKGDLGYLAVGAGAFLRVEIPRLAKRCGIDDEYVLYTDCDVMFLGDLEELGNVRPRYFAVAPEHRRRDYARMNTGVMVMNLPALREHDEAFRRYVADHLELFAGHAWDQSAYRGFYSTPLLRNAARDIRLLRTTAWLRRTAWDRLPVHYNWKPYWGDYSSARIVHFHGPKPQQRETLRSPNPPRHLEPVKPLARGSYDELCDLWHRILAECDSDPRPA